MFDLIDGQERPDNKKYTYEQFENGEIVLAKGDYKKVMNVIHNIFGIMIAVDTKEIFIYDNRKGYYKEISPDQLTGIYEKLTGEHMSTSTSDVFKKKIFRWFGEDYCLRKHSIIEKFVESSKRYVCFKNGLFDLELENFFPHRKTVYFRNAIDANYTTDKNCPIFSQYMKDFTTGREEVERTLLEFFSYCFVSGYHFGHNFLVLTGTGRNGKSTLIRLIANVLGQSATSNVPIDKLEGFELDFIAGKLLNYSGESSNNWTDGESLANLKAITGGDSISIKAKFKRSYQESNLPKMIFAMNHLPKFGETTLALRKRLICIEGLMSLDGREDSSIEDRLYSERDAIVSMLMDHLITVKNNRKVFVYENNNKVLNNIEKDSSIYSRFFYDRIKAERDSELWQDELWSEFKKYCESEDYKFDTSKTVFAKKLSQLLEPHQIRKKRNNGKVRTIYFHIGFHPTEDTSDEYVD